METLQRTVNRNLIGRTLSDAGDVQWKLTTKNDSGNHLEMAGVLRNTTYGEELPVVFLYPKKWLGRTVVWLARNGKAGLYNSDGMIRAEVAQLLDNGVTVAGIDLLYQGEFTPDGKSVTRTRTVKNPRESAAFTLGYNDSLFAQRVHDVLTVLSYTRKHERPSEKTDLFALDSEVAPIAVAACTLSDGAFANLVVDTGGFRFGRLLDLRDPNFLPGGAKYGDLPAMLCTSKSTWLAGEEEEKSPINQRFQKDALIDKGGAEGKTARAVAWLIKH